MAYEAEIDSFIQKFKSLVKNGSEAYLNLNTYSGQVWVNLRAGFSCIESDPFQQQNRIRIQCSPARQRR